MQEVSWETSSSVGAVRVVGRGSTRWERCCGSTSGIFINIAMVLGGGSDTHMIYVADGCQS